jgi:hypothetical protein
VLFWAGVVCVRNAKKVSVMTLSRDETTGEVLDVGVCHSTMIGTCTVGHCKSGHGRYEFSDGDVYDGNYQYCDGAPDSVCPGNPKALFDGHGVYTYEDRAKYDGEWKDNKMHGHGVYTFASGDKYDGEWKDDKKHGHGVFTYGD